MIKKLLAKIRKNKPPYEPDVEVNLAGIVKKLFTKKKRPVNRPEF